MDYNDNQFDNHYEGFRPLSTSQKERLMEALSLDNKIGNIFGKVWKGIGVFFMIGVVFGVIDTVKTMMTEQSIPMVLCIILGVIMMVFGIGMPYSMFFKIGSLALKSTNLPLNAVRDDIARICVCNVKNIVKHVSHSSSGGRRVKYYAQVTIPSQTETDSFDEFEVHIPSTHKLVIGEDAYLVTYTPNQLIPLNMIVVDMDFFMRTSDHIVH